MSPIDFLKYVIDSQGIEAGMLLVVIWQNWSMQTQLLKKICTLQGFVMQCLDKQLTHDIKVLDEVHAHDPRLE